MKNNYLNFKFNSKSFLFIQLVFLLGIVFSVNAQVMVPFAQRTSQYTPTKKIYNVKGDFTMMGNTNLTLQNYGVTTNNNSNTMVYVDVDGNSIAGLGGTPTFNSSAATLSLSTENGAVPSCSRIVYAGLYWTGRADQSGTASNTFSVTKSFSNGSQSVNNDYNVIHNGSITNTSYTLTVSRGGSTGNFYPIYTFSNGTNSYVFNYTNNTGAAQVTMSLNGATATNIPVTVAVSGTIATATLTSAYSISDATVALLIKNLVRSTSLTLNTSNTQLNSNANVNVSGTISASVSYTKNFDKRKIMFKGPGSSAYTQFTAASTDIYYPTTTGDYIYSSYAEVTDYVRQNGLGEYLAADIALRDGNGGGTGYSGGWGLIVVYENSKMKYRDVTIFDGHAYIVSSNTTPFDLPVSGFNTVQTGNVGVKLGLMASEGDIGLTGDYFSIQKNSDATYLSLSDSANSTTNFFNSSVNTGGNLRNPNLANNTGIDIHMFDVPNTSNSVIGNSQTSTNFRYGTSGDTYAIFSIAMAVDAYVPEPENILTATAINSVPVTTPPYSVLPGQDTSFNVNIKNFGTEAINNYKLVVPIPFNASYVAGSAVGNIYFSPLPVPNTITFDPTLGATGSIVWDFGTLPLLSNTNTLLASLTFKLRATTDCSILSNSSCGNTILVNGVSSGVGAITGTVLSNKPFIQGYTQNGNCSGEPIAQSISMNINATNYVTANCQNTPLVRNFNFCNSSTTVAATQISPNFPLGTLFYNQYPVTTSAIQYTDSNPFPLVSGSTTTYYAIPPNSSGCNFPFTISKCAIIDAINDNYSNINCTSTGVIGNVLSNDLLNNVVVPSNLVTFTLLTGSNPNISFDSSGNVTVTSGIAAGTYVFTYKICENANSSNCDTATVTIIVKDETAPVIATLPSPTTISCPTVPSFSQAFASDTCSSVSLTFNDVRTNGTCLGNYSITRTWTATDSSGNTSTASQIINVIDTTAPVINSLPSVSTINYPSIPQFTQATAVDACGTAILTYNDVNTPGRCAGNYSITRTWTATDSCGNSSTASQTINVQDLTGSQIPKPSLQCYQSATFNLATCSWDVTGTQPTAPAVLCYQTATWNPTSCQYDITGTQPTAPAVLCYQTATWNPTSCQYDVTGEQPVAPTVLCYQTATWNPTSCQYDVTGEQPTAPTVLCYQTATWNPTSCQYDVTGTQPTAPAVLCYQTATWNPTSCQYDVTGTQPTAPAVLCYQTATWNPTSCQYDVTGTQPTPPTVLCYQTATWNPTSCQYDVTGTQPTAPAVLCYQTATWNATSCQYDIIGTQPTAPAVLCYQTATWNPTSCQYDITGTQPTAPAVLCYQTATWNPTSCDYDVTGHDTTAPIFVGTLPTATLVLECSAVPIAPVLTATDVCGTVTVSYNQVRVDGSCANTYTLTRTWIATDNYGNQTVFVQTINVQDTVAPQLATPYPSVLNVTCNAIPAVPQLQFTDDCSSAPITTVFNESTSTVASDGTYIITRIWTVIDVCGNSRQYTQKINVTISNFIQTTSVSSQCNDDNSLLVDTINLLDTQFPGVTSSTGTWSVNPPTTGLNPITGIFLPLGVPVGNYVVTYNNNDPVCPSTVAITIPIDASCFVDPCNTLNIHNAVTPNGDGMNEYFDIENITEDCYKENTVEIYNRWGVLVFDVTNYDNSTKVFRGMSEGRATVKQSSELPSGTYFYILKYKGSEGNYTTKNGYLYLSR